eukprot:436440_1
MRSERVTKKRWTSTVSEHYSIPLLSTYQPKNINQTNFKYIALSILIFACLLLPAFYAIHENYDKSSACTTSSNHRNLLSSEKDCFEKAADPGYLAIFCFLGTLYMFIALSIVCDEFFVPSLETITLKLQISNDVAGATLMAAGGSAPELFTSFIGTFQETDVGFAAIVGSAVFNVLFVIGVCAISAPKPLQLTWWPLARDCSYYAFGLSVLAIFFIPVSGKKIEWFESLTLFMLYIGYVIFMKYNRNIYEWIQKCVEKNSKYKRTKTEVVLEDVTKYLHDLKGESVCIKKEDLCRTTFRAGMLNILLKDKWDWHDVASITIVNQISGDVRKTFDKIDVDKNGFIDINELQALLTGLNADISQNPIEELMKELDTNNDGKLSFKEFSVWYVSSEERILGETKHIYDIIDTDKNGVLSVSEIHAFLEILGIEHLSHDDITQIFKDNQIEIDDGMTFEQFKKWFISTEYYQEKLKCFSNQSKCVAESTDKIFEFPSTWIARFWFIITMPLIILFVSSIPDTRNPNKAKYCYFSFFMSIVWIGVFSYFLVEWTSIVGDTLHIPLVVMGLTFLAAGTSIPDLLSSVIVAKQGLGDMAVSSSIGSNIFDILVGLPIPWLLYTIYHSGKPVNVNADALEISILILLGMLVVIIVIIKLANWKMTPVLGCSMMVLYVVFVAQDLARADWSC